QTSGQNEGRVNQPRQSSQPPRRRAPGVESGDVDERKNPAVHEVGQDAKEFGSVAVRRQHGPEQVRGVHARHAQPLADEGFRFFPIAQAEQGPHGERGVAQPAKTVVPIQVATDTLRQRRSRRGNDGPRGSVGEELEHQGATHYLVSVRPAVATKSRPAPPPFGRESELLRKQLARRWEYRWSFGRIQKGESSGCPGPQPEPRRRSPLGGRGQLDIAQEGDEMRTPIDAQTQFPRVPKGYPNTTVVRARIEVNLHLDLASLTLDPPHQLLFRPEYASLFFLGSGRHEVGEDKRACGGVKARLQYVRVVEITAFHLRCLDGRDAPGAADPRVQKAREQGRAIKARPAQPVQRTVARNQRDGSPVSNGGVILDLRHRPVLLVSFGMDQALLQPIVGG